jgi:deazaflavin-dependent oxidoreductase (nitroreductase family)
LSGDPSRLARLRADRGLLRLLFRMPLLLYRARLGRLLGERFVRLTVVGRRSGRPRDVVVEVVDRDPARSRYVVFSAWGERSQWARNLLAHPEARVEVGARRFAARATRLPPAELADHLEHYARRHPFAWRLLIGPLLRGERPREGREDWQRIAADATAFALEPLSDQRREAIPPSTGITAPVR